jgi:uncharacterized protein DUF885
MSAGSAGATKAAESAWNALVDEYFEQAYFKFSPTAGTSAGLHQYDAQLEHFSHAAVDREIETLHRFESRFAGVDPKGLDEVQAADREILLSSIRGRLLTLETIRPWEKNPDVYSSGATNSIYVIMIRKFAPVDERLKSAVAREKQIPALFAAARQNLKNPARISTEIALEQLPGLISFFRLDVPAAFADATDAGMKAEFAKSNAEVIAALGSYQEWLQKDLLPRSKGNFRIGAETYSKKLLYDEMVDMPLDRLLEIAKADLRKNQEEFRRIAKEVDAEKTPQQVLETLGKMHPAPDQIVGKFSRDIRRADRVHPRETHHYDSVGGAADAAGDAAVHARNDVCFDGHAGAV